MEALDYDVILKEIGSFGCYQISVVLIIFYMNLLMLMNICFMNFGALMPSNSTFDNLTENGQDEFYSIITEWNLMQPDQRHIPFVASMLQMLGCTLAAPFAGYKHLQVEGI